AAGPGLVPLPVARPDCYVIRRRVKTTLAVVLKGNMRRRRCLGLRRPATAASRRTWPAPHFPLPSHSHSDRSSSAPFARPASPRLSVLTRSRARLARRPPPGTEEHLRLCGIGAYARRPGGQR